MAIQAISNFLLHNPAAGLHCFCEHVAGFHWSEYLIQGYGCLKISFVKLPSSKDWASLHAHHMHKYGFLIPAARERPVAVNLWILPVMWREFALCRRHSKSVFLTLESTCLPLYMVRFSLFSRDCHAWKAFSSSMFSPSTSCGFLQKPQTCKQAYRTPTYVAPKCVFWTLYTLHLVSTVQGDFCRYLLFQFTHFHCCWVMWTCLRGTSWFSCCWSLRLSPVLL